MSGKQSELSSANELDAYALTESSLIPILGNVLRPLAILGIRGIIGVVDCTKSTIQLVREEIEDIVAEAQFERLKQEMNEEIEIANRGQEKESD